MTSFRQNSFSGGELSPTLLGRGDIQKYSSGLKSCRNFIPTIGGQALNRPGMEYLGAVKDSTKTVRLLPFIYSDSDTYVLEFGNLYVRFWKNGALIESAPSVPYEVVTTYLEVDLPYLKTAQVGDVLWIACKGYAPKKLTRLADASWTLGAVSFSNGLSADHYFPDGQAVLVHDPAAPGTFTEDVANGLPGREWIWKVTAITQDSTTGLTYESLPWTVTKCTLFGAWPFTYAAITAANIAVYPSIPIEVGWDYTAGLFGPPGNILAWRVYRGRGKLFGFVGETTTTRFIDKGDVPDYTVQPPLGRNPFQVLDNAGAVTRTETPAAVSFFEQRLTFARTTERPGWLWLSATSNYSNFDRHLTLVEDDAVELELASMRREEIRSLVGADKLFILTSGGLWTLAGAGGPLTAFSLQAIKQSDEGASWLSPLVVRDALMYVRNRGLGVNLLDFEQERQKYSLVDLTILARHFFEGQEVVDWAYAHDPFSVIWAVRDDGALLSLTYNRAQEVWAWALHDTDGEVESVCVVPEGTEDAVYFVVRRNINGTHKRYVERFAPRVGIADVRDGIFLDAATQSVRVAAAPSDTLSGFSYLEGKAVKVLADGAVHGPFTVAAGVITLDQEIGSATSDVTVCVGISYFPYIEFLDLVADKQDIRTKQKQVRSVFVDVEATSGVLAGPTIADEDLVEAKLRRVVGGYSAPDTQSKQVEIKVKGAWDTTGRAAIAIEDPVPLTIIGVSREVEFGGS